MNKKLILAAILSIGMMSSAFAGNSNIFCVNPLNVLLDPVVGAWNGTISIPHLGFTGPVNYSIHAGGTLNGQGVQCIGVPLTTPIGNLFTVDTGVWKRMSLNTYQVKFSDIGVAPTSIFSGAEGTLPTSTIGRTGFIGNATMTSCSTMTITGTIGIYGSATVDDPTLSSATVGPFNATITLSLVGFH